MNELKLLADLGEHLDEQTPATLPRQRQRLLEAAHGGRRGTRRIPRLPLVLTASAVTGAVAAGLIVAETGSGQPKATAPTIQVNSASFILEKAARVVAARPFTAPKPRQWVYEKTAEYGANTAAREHPTVSEDWVRFDGRQEAVIEGGRLVVDNKEGGGQGTPAGAAALLRSLPADPQALLATLSKKVGTEPRGDATQGPDGLLFANIVQLIRDAPAGVPPKTQAALYRAIATLDGVRVDNNVVDGLGRHLIGVTLGSTHQFTLIDPATFQIVGMQSTWSGRPTPAEVEMSKHKKINLDLPEGAVTYGLVTLTTAVVDHAGQR